MANNLGITAASYWNNSTIEMRQILFPSIHPLSHPLTFADLDEDEKETIRVEVAKFK